MLALARDIDSVSSAMEAGGMDLVPLCICTSRKTAVILWMELLISLIRNTISIVPFSFRVWCSRLNSVRPSSYAILFTLEYAFLSFTPV